MHDLLPFQRKFITQATHPDVETALWSSPRGNGKSWLAGYLLTRLLTPEDELFRRGTESVLCAGSIEQARIVYKFVRDELEPTGEYRFLDSATRIGITHKRTHTKLRVISSNGKTAMGLVNTPYAIADEPGSWEMAGGQLMYDALMTAQGKPNSPLKIVFIGTIAPADRGWWPEMVDRGSHGSTYVQKLVGDPEKWDQWSEIRRCNPLTKISPEFRKKLFEERDEARKDSRLKARFLSYRLNVPTADEADMLLTVEDWKLMLPRPVPERKGRPVTAIDMGGGRGLEFCGFCVEKWQDGSGCPGSRYSVHSGSRKAGPGAERSLSKAGRRGAIDRRGRLARATSRDTGQAIEGTLGNTTRHTL